MQTLRIYFTRIISLLAIILLFLGIFSFVYVEKIHAVAGINRTINFQGKLVNNPAKTNVTNTSYAVVFTVYDRGTGGTALWSETQTVTTADGIFRVSLGSVTPFPSDFNFNWDGLYLGMKVNADAEMTPRVTLSAVPYAFNSQRVSGLTVLDDAGNSSTSGTLRVGNSKTITFSGSNGLTFNDPGGLTTITFPATGSITLLDLSTSQVLTNKSIGSTGLTFSGATTDIATGANEDLVVAPNGSGRTILSSDFDSPILVGSSVNTSAILSVRGGIGNNASFIVDNLNNGDLIAASSSGTTRFRVNATGDLIISGAINLGGGNGSSSQCLLGGPAASWGSCGSSSNWTLNTSTGVIRPNNNTADLILGGIASASAKFQFTNMISGNPTLKIFDSTSTNSLNLFHDGTNAYIQSSIGDVIIGAGSSDLIIENAISNDTTNNSGSLKISDKLLVQKSESVALGVFDNLGTGDIFTASASGTTRFAITSAGAFNIGGAYGSLGECLKSGGGTSSILTWGVCSNSAGTWVIGTNGAHYPVNNTLDLLIGGTSSSSAKFGILNVNGSASPVASLSATTASGGNGAGLVLDTANSSIQSLRRNTLSLGGNTTGNIQFSPGGLTNPNLFLKTNGDIGINSTNPLATLDIRVNTANSGGTLAVASISGSTSFAGLLVDNNGVGDLFTASKSGDTKFVIKNNGTIGLDIANYSSCGTFSTDSSAQLSCGVSGSSSGDTLLAVYVISTGSGLNLTVNFSGVANSQPSSASGTITFPSNTGKLKVELKGAGGGGGGTGTANAVKGAGGGGEGGYAEEFISSVVSNYYIKVGGGGAGGGSGAIGATGTESCFGTNASDACTSSTVKATGGAGGATSNSALSVLGGVGGAGSNGDLIIAGAPGGNSGAVAAATFSGPGGGIGGGRSIVTAACGSSGNAGLNGGGGSGGLCSTNAAFASGGRGGDGYLVIYIYKNGDASAAGWNQFASGVLAPDILTTDVLFGGNSTASAKFGFLNNVIGTPTASISANSGNIATYLTGLGNLQTTNNQTFTLGGSTTGNIAISPNNGGAGSLLTVNSLLMTLSGTTTLTGTSLTSITGGATAIDFTEFDVAAGTGAITINDGGDLGNISIEGTILDINSLDFAAAGVITTGSNNNLTITPNGTGNTLISSDADSGLQVSSVAVSASTLHPLFVNGGISNRAAFVVNNTNSGDLITASVSGTTRFILTNSGIASASAGFTINGSGSIASTNNQTLTLGGGDTGNVIINPFAAALFGVGTTAPTATFDLRAASGTRIGGTSAIQSISGQTSFAALVVNNSGNGDLITASASGVGKFNVTKNGTVGINSVVPLGTFDVRANTFNGGTTPVASVSGNTSFAALVANNSGAGDIFTASAGGATKFVVTASGNVGIGVTLPTERLDISGGNIKIGAQTNSTTALTKRTQTQPGQISVGGTTLISSVSASAVFNGSLYVGTGRGSAAGGGAEVYRYDPTATSSAIWTKVTQVASGTIASGGTTNIASVSSMIVFNGALYAGTSKTGAAEVYRYGGGNTWTKVSAPTAGTLLTTTLIDGITSMAVYNGNLYVGTKKNAAAELYRYDNNAKWVAINSTAGTLGAGQITVDAITSMASYNEGLYVGTKKGRAASVWRYNGGTGASVFTAASNATPGTVCSNTLQAEVSALTVYNGSLYAATSSDQTTTGTLNQARVCRYDYNPDASTASLTWTDVTNATAGTIRTGGTANIDGIKSMTVYNGRLYIGTNEPNGAEIYQYLDGQEWMVLNGTAGTIASGGTASIDAVTTLIQYNSSLFAGTSEPSPTTVTAAEVYEYKNITDQSFALKFNAASNITPEVNGLTNNGSIWFMASPSGSLSTGGANNTGSFMFSHGIVTGAGAYDVAEDYGTRDDSLEAGDLVSIDEGEKEFVRKSQGLNDKLIVGVYSENPALHLSQIDPNINGGRAVPVALAGRVPVKVSTENGDIKPGDYLIPSSIKGVAMKAKKAGPVIGQAMGEFAGEGVGRVTVYIKSASYNGSIAASFMELDNSSANFAEDVLSALAAQGGNGLSGSEVVTDTLIAQKEIITPTLTVDYLFAKHIKADQIDGLEFIDNKSILKEIALLKDQFKELNNLVNVSTQSAKLSSESAMLENSSQELLSKLLSRDLEGASMSATVSQESLTASIESIDGLSLVSGNLRVKGNGLIEGILTVIETLKTNDLIVNGVSTFFGDVIFKGDVNITGKATFGNDVGGDAVIIKDKDRVEIIFDKEYEENPVVNASVSFEEERDKKGKLIDSTDLEEKYFKEGYSYIIVNKSTKGFIIVLNKKAKDDLSFTWTALRVKDAKTFQSMIPKL